MTARLDSFQHRLAVVGAMLFTAVIVLSTPALPFA